MQQINTVNIDNTAQTWNNEFCHDDELMLI